MSRRFSVDDSHLGGVSIEQQVEKMDEAGIDVAILVVQRMGPYGSPGHWAMDPGFAMEAVDSYPTRFVAQAGVDPTAGINEVRRLRSLVEDHGFVGAHFYPHWFDLSPDSPIAYPIYAACADLGIPIQVQVGQSLVYSSDRPLRSVGRPMSLEPIARDFPELRLIGSHLGYPWIDEIIALTALYPNVYICTDSYAPSYWSEAMDRFVAGEGTGKVMFGTMWPTIPFERAVGDIKAKQLSQSAYDQLMGGTARSVYSLL